jgi:hypothetical protein
MQTKPGERPVARLQVKAKIAEVCIVVMDGNAGVGVVRELGEILVKAGEERGVVSTQFLQRCPQLDETGCGG